MSTNPKILFLCCLFTLTLPAVSLAETSVEDGLYLGLFVAQTPLGGDFDGDSYYTNTADYEIYYPTELDDGIGFGLTLGTRSGKSSFELSYQRTTHDQTQYPGDKAYLNAIDFNAKFDIFAKDQLRPYLLLGCGIPWLTCDNCTYDIYADEWDDTTYLGVSLNGGIGLSYYLNPKFCLTGGILYRWMSFFSADGCSLDENLNASEIGFTAGAALTF